MRRAGLVVAAWLAAAAALTAVAPSFSEVGTADVRRFLPTDAPSQRAQALLDRAWPDEASQDTAAIVVERRGGLRPEDLKALHRVEAWIAASIPEVASVTSGAGDSPFAGFLRAEDGAAALTLVRFGTQPFSDQTGRAIERIRARLAVEIPREAAAHVTGAAAIAADQIGAIRDSFDRTAIITLVLILAILLWVYRSPVAAVIPLATIGVAFAISRALAALLADAGVEVASQVETFMLLLVFGAGTDYCLFLLSRYREERRADAEGALERTRRRVTKVLIASGATVALAFLSQLSARFGIYRSMGPAIGLAVVVTVAATLTLTPAIARLLGARTFWPAHPEREAGTPAATRRWMRTAQRVTTRPALVLVVGVGLLAVPAVFAVGIRSSFDILDELPAGADARRGFQAVERHFPAGRITPTSVIISAPSRLDDAAGFALARRVHEAVGTVDGVAEALSAPLPAGRPITFEVLDQARALGLDPDRLAGDPKVLDRVASQISSPQGLIITPALVRQAPVLQQMMRFFVSADGRLARVIVSVSADPFSNRAIETAEAIGRAADAAVGSDGTDARVLVGGPTAFFSDMRRIGNQDFRAMIAIVVALVLVIFALLLRSAVAPFYLLATVLLSFAATLGATVLVFQTIGGAEGISLWVPPFLFIMLVALGADYNIFLMSRIDEEYRRTGDVREATRQGLAVTGRVITSAGLILAGTFAALLAAPMPNLRQIGFALTFGILLDTFVVRTLLVPSATVLLGESAWWPRALAPVATAAVPEPEVEHA